MFGNLTSFEGGLFDDFRRLEEEMDTLFGRWPWPAEIRATARGSYPSVNIGSTAEQVDVYVFAAGIDPKKLDIAIQQNLLTVSGERDTAAQENATYYRQERFGGSFRRVITLPENVDPDHVDANYRDGVLHIQIKRREATRPRQITVS